MFKRVGSHRKDGWYEIDQTGAVEILSTRRVKNRPLSEAKAASYAAEMTAKRWAKNGEPLIFDVKMRLLDGQHRLRAVVLSGIPLVTYCIFDVEQSVFDTMDQGKARTGSDIAAIRGLKNYSLAAAITGLLVKSRDGQDPVNPAKHLWGWVYDDYVTRNRGVLEESAAFVTKFRKELKPIITLSLAGYVYHVGRAQNPETAPTFIEQLATGANLTKKSAVLYLRNRLMTPVSGKSAPLVHLGRFAVYNLTVKAWCYHRDSLPCTRLALREDERPTMFTKYK